ncbi:MAG: T9SS type A sorting domain-containing protein [Ignavibacteria bacterium]|nr:T9SS type A sorting domain-containing protein [Ignavibacteria bacterium]
MKSAILLFILFFALLCCTYIFSQQSSITYQSGSVIEIQTGADVCADIITINGSYSGGGSICTGALPVTLSLFNALSEKNNVTLRWKTETEINNSGFELQRRIDESDWLKIAFLPGNGTVNTPVEYQYTDTKLPPGKYFYRLKQIDYSGSFEYYELAFPVLISKPKVFALGQSYPNPSNPKCNIDFQLPEKVKVNIRIYDVLGRLAAVLADGEMEAGIHTVEFNGSSLSSGTYFYRFTAGSYTEVKKLILVK